MKQPTDFKLKSRQRGTAMVEGVIVLPVFLLLFVGVFYLRDMVTRRQALDTLARSCAWRYADNGCEVIPDDCAEDNLLQKTPFEGNDQGEEWITGQGDDLRESIKSAEGGTDGDKVVDAVWGIVSQALEETFTKAATATPQGTLKPPALIGGEEKVVTSHFQLSCNLKPVTAKSLVMEAWQGVM